MATNTNPRTGRGRSRYSDMDSQGGILAALDSHANTSNNNGATRKPATKSQVQKQATRTQKQQQQQPRRSIATSPTLDGSLKKAAREPPASVIFSTDADSSDDDDEDDDDDASESSMSVLSSSIASPCPLASSASSPSVAASFPVITKTQPLRRNIMYPRSRGGESEEDDDDDDDDSDEEESDDMSDDNDDNEEEEDSRDEPVNVNAFQHAVDKHNKRSKHEFSEDDDDESKEEEEELSTASSEDEEEEEEIFSEEEYDPESDGEATLTDDEELADEGAALDEEDEEIKRKLKKPSKKQNIKASVESDMDTGNDEVQVIESPTNGAAFSPAVAEQKEVNKEQNEILDPHTSTNKSVEEHESRLDESCDVVEVYLCDDDDDDDDGDVLAATVYYDDAVSDSDAQTLSNDENKYEVLSESQPEENEEEEESYDGNGDGTVAFLSDDEADGKEACPTETESGKQVESPKPTEERKQDDSNTAAVLCEKQNVAAKNPATTLEIIHSTPSPRQQRGRPRQRQGRREGNIQRGKWSLGSKIGSGAFGVVHIGMNTATGSLMAVKSVKMDRAVMKDVRREIDLLRSLKHTNIVRYHGAEMDKTHLHIFQEWVAGGSVTGMLAKFGPFSLDVLRSYLSQTLNGLAYLHENDIMHRDIKGSNILVSDEGIVKLADFGASKRLESAQKDMMQSLTMRGTPYFMAVEVFEEKYSMKADVWSVGCVAIQMATGSPPWKSLGYSNPVALFSHLKSHNDPPPINIASKDMNPLEFGLLKSVVAKCFKRDPSERPSAKSLQHDPFFSEVHTLSDDDHSVGRGLFSPESHCSWEAMHSPISAKRSPIPSRSSRSNSVGPRRSPFMSPPLPKRTGTGLRASPAPLSPQADTNEWPTWAREKHESSTAAAAVAPTAQGLAKLEKADALTGKVIDLMGSLALSDDSCMASPAFCGNNRESSVFRRSSTVQSPLEGLQFAGYNSSLGGASPAGN